MPGGQPLPLPPCGRFGAPPSPRTALRPEASSVLRGDASARGVAAAEAPPHPNMVCAFLMWHAAASCLHSVPPQLRQPRTPIWHAPKPNMACTTAEAAPHPSLYGRAVRWVLYARLRPSLPPTRPNDRRQLQPPLRLAHNGCHLAPFGHCRPNLGLPQVPPHILYGGGAGATTDSPASCPVVTPTGAAALGLPLGAVLLTVGGVWVRSSAEVQSLLQRTGHHPTTTF